VTCTSPLSAAEQVGAFAEVVADVDRGDLLDHPAMITSNCGECIRVSTARRR
jgi:hypothetical protein